MADRFTFLTEEGGEVRIEVSAPGGHSFETLTGTCVEIAPGGRVYYLQFKDSSGDEYLIATDRVSRREE